MGWNWADQFEAHAVARTDPSDRLNWMDARLKWILANEVSHPAESELHQRVDQALDSIRPYLMADGGSVKLLDITPEMVVELELLGACGECPISEMTLRAGIEQAIKRAVPDVTRVEAIKRP